MFYVIEKRKIKIINKIKIIKMLAHQKFTNEKICKMKYLLHFAQLHI
jgi:hypothetical protein